jgi:hypothetical protein
VKISTIGKTRRGRVSLSPVMAIEGRPVIEKIKRIAALLLLIASLLPFAQCSKNPKEPVPSSNQVIKVIEKSQERIAHPEVDRPIYVWQQFKVSETDSWFLVLAFVWPVPLLIARWKVSFKYIKTATQLLEIPLCAFTAFLLYCYIRDPVWQLLSGWYVAAVGTALYITAILCEVSNRFRNHNWS